MPFVPLQDHGRLAVTPVHGNAGRGQFDGLLHQPPGKPDPVPIQPPASPIAQRLHALVRQIKTDLLQNVEHSLAYARNSVLRQHLKAGD